MLKNTRYSGWKKKMEEYRNQLQGAKHPTTAPTQSDENQTTTNPPATSEENTMAGTLSPAPSIRPSVHQRVKDPSRSRSRSHSRNGPKVSYRESDAEPRLPDTETQHDKTPQDKDTYTPFLLPQNNPNDQTMQKDQPPLPGPNTVALPPPSETVQSLLEELVRAQKESLRATQQLLHACRA